MCMFVIKIALEKVVFVYVKAWSLCAVVNKKQMWLLVPELLEIRNVVFEATKTTSPNIAKKKHFYCMIA